MTAMRSITDTLASTLSRLPSRDDLGEALGFAPRRSAMDDISSALAIFAAGMLLGAGIAILLAPEAGRQLREALGTGVGSGGRIADRDEDAAYANAPGLASPAQNR